MKRKIIFLVVAFALIFGLTLTANTFKTSPQTPVPTGDIEANTGTLNSYTLAEVATHKDASSCWSVVGSGVYDLTSWINQHPGGKLAILMMCGTDATTAFNVMHGGQARPERELASFKIGTYKQ